jgi:hypothetical protein
MDELMEEIDEQNEDEKTFANYFTKDIEDDDDINLSDE